MKPKKHHIIHKTQNRDRDTNEVYMTLQVCEVSVKVPPFLIVFILGVFVAQEVE